MSNANLSTLRTVLAQPIVQEPQLVHLLVEVRNVVEIIDNRFQILKFFCDWVLHPRMERGPAKQIIKTFDGFLESSLMNRWTALKMMNHAYPLTSLRGFRNDLFVFFAKHRLDGSLIWSSHRFEKFLSLYVERISRTPLVAPQGAFKNLDEIRVRKLATPSTPQREGERFVFGIEWLFIHNGIARQPLVNDVWLPSGPFSVPVSFPQEESKTFWKP
jgi:hypothetical protein